MVCSIAVVCSCVAASLALQIKQLFIVPNVGKCSLAMFPVRLENIPDLLVCTLFSARA